MRKLRERRQSQRVVTHSELLVGRIGGFSFNVAMKDISSGGCRVEMLEPSQVVDRVIARLARLEPLASCVKWPRGNTGTEFLSKMHPAVFNLVLARLPTPCSLR